MRDYIKINKDLIPYNFDITLAGELFNLRIDYNSTGRFFTVCLSKDGEIVCAGEPLIYGRPLWESVWRKGKYPQIDIVPYDDSGDRSKVTWSNLNETVFLVIDNEGESIVK